VEETGEPGSSRWGTALALGLAVLLLGAADPLPLILVPLAGLMVAFPPERRIAVLLALLLAVWVLVQRGSPGPLGGTTRAWALVLAAALVGAVAWRQGAFLGRGLMALSAAAAGVGLWLGATGGWRVLDGAARERVQTIATDTFNRLSSGSPGTPWAADPAMPERVAHLWWTLFPALLAMQSLAGLGLAWWIWARSGPPGDRRVPLGRLREFRFADELVWVPIVAIVIVVLPLGGALTRAAGNVLFFMGGLYVLRGMGVFAHLLAGMPPFGLVVGAMFALLLYPFALAAALAMGVGDTWLDLRGRASKSTA
jgi:hypothetical protein